jgi:hypothetical protein
VGFHCPAKSGQAPAKHRVGILLAHHQSVGIWNLGSRRRGFTGRRLADEMVVAIVEARRQAGLRKLTDLSEYAKRLKDLLRSGT